MAPLTIVPGGSAATIDRRPGGALVPPNVVSPRNSVTSRALPCVALQCIGVKPGERRVQRIGRRNSIAEPRLDEQPRRNAGVRRGRHGDRSIAEDRRASVALERRLIDELRRMQQRAVDAHSPRLPSNRLQSAPAPARGAPRGTSSARTRALRTRATDVVKLVESHQDVARLGAIRRPEHAGGVQLVDDARSTTITNLETPLQ